MSSVLVDTGPLYALVDPDDQYHVRARSELKRISEERFDLKVAWPVVLEAYSLVLRRLGVRVARTWLEQLVQGAGLLNPEREDYLGASRLLERYSDQPITLVDGTLATLAFDLGIPVWTYDHHFDVMGAPVWR
jgi:predicted nucleic acid-binding protein